MEPFYKYYIVQVQTAFVANDYCDCDLTQDEEEAYAFTTLAEATNCADEVAGVVLLREVKEQELAEVDNELDADYFQQFCQQLAEL
ncbi:MAG: hypothetical protein ABS949_02835 [Solibacillus sp.]